MYCIRKQLEGKDEHQATGVKKVKGQKQPPQTETEHWGPRVSSHVQDAKAHRLQ